MAEGGENQKSLPSGTPSKGATYLQIEPSSPALSSSSQSHASRRPVPNGVRVSVMEPPNPTPTPLPERSSHEEHNHDEPKDHKDHKETNPELTNQHFHAPKLRLEIRDLNHPGSQAFLAAINASDCLNHAVKNVQTLLYHNPTCPTTTLPTTRSVTVILRDMAGVAYTTGSDLDSDHKEIHFALPYIARQPPARCCDEITGVLTHELVHCYQYNAYGTCPGGLIEGIADWVRLNCDLCPPHWRKHTDGSWDRGYEATAYFLDYLERRFGNGTVRQMNEKLRLQKYHEKHFWTELLGRPVEQLWGDYCEKVKEEEKGKGESDVRGW